MPKNLPSLLERKNPHVAYFKKNCLIMGFSMWRHKKYNFSIKYAFIQQNY